MIIELSKGPSVDAAAPIGARRIVKMIPSMGIYGTNCPILWKSNVKNEANRFDVVIMVARPPALTVIAGDIDDEAYKNLPETVIEW